MNHFRASIFRVQLLRAEQKIRLEKIRNFQTYQTFEINSSVNITFCVIMIIVSFELIIVMIFLKF